MKASKPMAIRLSVANTRSLGCHGERSRTVSHSRLTSKLASVGISIRRSSSLDFSTNFSESKNAKLRKTNVRSNPGS
jgi:hypothetical protein